MKKQYVIIATVLLVTSAIAFIARTLAAGAEGEVKTISFQAQAYSDPGSWLINKSAKWIGVNKVEITFDVFPVIF